ncbi:MAG: NAD(+)/NADH kinase [Candidatus Diapherotrites archaeon]|uniref:NAD kinase n=1 Tax=Candidatus Iainarchaeum sp. TaxID=3101447 RepID=A0A8T3YRU0_9ARCH|nr:NAD(+)/NADH kinase [Candidatus Diapherotrites archaeon]
MALKIGITGRRHNPLAVQTARRAMAILKAGGASLETDTAFLGKGKPLRKMRPKILLSFGGDGTLLQVFREARKKVPVMGINCGSRGFLQAWQNTKIEKAMKCVLEGRYKVEERTRILAKIDGKKAGEALNEVLVVPAKAGRLMRYRIRVGKEEREENGDGLIVATPTGSTAHALSAGGPIVKGNAAVFVVVSMNPVDWKHRPLIINDHEKVMVSPFGPGKAEAILDGQQRFGVKKKIELTKGGKVLLAMPTGK